MPIWLVIEPSHLIHVLVLGTQKEPGRYDLHSLICGHFQFVT